MDRYDPYTDKFLRDTQYDILGTNLAEVGTELISRQAAIAIAKYLLIHLEEYHQYNQAINNYCAEIIELPPAQPEQRTGKWIPSDSQCGIRCSACGAPVDDFCHSIDYIDLDYEPNFCPNCGAKMEGDAE